MKKKFFIMAAILSAQLAQGKDYHVVVKNETTVPKGHTEVYDHEEEGSDTICVTPGDGVTTITVTLTDLDGNVIGHEVLFGDGDCVEFSTPDGADCLFLEVRDNRGYVYRDIK